MAYRVRQSVQRVIPQVGIRGPQEPDLVGRVPCRAVSVPDAGPVDRVEPGQRAVRLDRAQRLHAGDRERDIPPLGSRHGRERSLGQLHAARLVGEGGPHRRAYPLGGGLAQPTELLALLLRVCRDRHRRQRMTRAVGGLGEVSDAAADLEQAVLRSRCLAHRAEAAQWLDEVGVAIPFAPSIVRITPSSDAMDDGYAPAAAAASASAYRVATVARTSSGIGTSPRNRLNVLASAAPASSAERGRTVGSATGAAPGSSAAQSR